MMRRKAMVLLCSTVLCVSLLSGCGKSIKLPFSGGISSAEELLEKNKERKMKSFHLDGDMKLKMELGDSEDSQVSLSIPVGIGADGDVYEENAHLNITTKASLFGVNSDVKQEMYLDGEKGKVYQKSADKEGWTVQSSSDKDSDTKLQDITSISKSLVKDAEFEETDDGYKITIDAKKLKDISMFNSLTDMEESKDSDTEVDISKGTIEYTFNEDCDLTNVAFDDIEMKAKSDMMGQSVNAKVGINGDFKISKHNKVSEDDVVVPDDIVKNAVPGEGTSGLGLGNLGGSDDLGTEDPGFGSTEDPGIEEPGTESPGTETPTSGDDKFGAIDGIPLTADQNIFDETFGAAGFEIDEADDGQYSFSSCKNPEYEDLTLYVYQKDASSTNSTKEKIMSEGFYGYDIDAEFAKARPNMTWNGITWGATTEEVEAAYGTPDDTYVGDMYTSYKYNFGDNVELSFDIYYEGQKAPGLQHVTLSVFNAN